MPSSSSEPMASASPSAQSTSPRRPAASSLRELALELRMHGEALGHRAHVTDARASSSVGAVDAGLRRGQVPGRARRRARSVELGDGLGAHLVEDRLKTCALKSSSADSASSIVMSPRRTRVSV